MQRTPSTPRDSTARRLFLPLPRTAVQAEAKLMAEVYAYLDEGRVPAKP